MHGADILKYGHGTILQAVEGLPESEWNLPGACGFWSVREIVAHLASFEHLLVDIVSWILDKNSPTPILNQYIEEGLIFNDNQVAQRQNQTIAQTWAEYEEIFRKSSELFNKIPADLHRKTGLLTFYGAAYDLEDFLVYSYYGHKPGAWRPD